VKRPGQFRVGALMGLKQFVAQALGPYGCARASFAQEGEDIALDRLLEGQKNGFYVDVGCHHPFRFSNTYLFYRRGWSGICIDPLPGTAKLFGKWRKRDRVIETGVSQAPAELTYHMFDEPALNTFDAALAEERARQTRYRVVKSTKVPTDTLANILNRNASAVRTIDFLTVDVEGLDLEVLQSNDWQRYRPRIVLVECLSRDLAAIPGDPTARFLAEVGYVPHAKTGNSVIFVERPS